MLLAIAGCAGEPASTPPNPTTDPAPAAAIPTPPTSDSALRASEAVVPSIADPDGVDPAVLEALSAAVARIRNDPRDASAWGGLGRLYHATEYLELARECYTTAADLDREVVEWPYLVAVLDADRGRLESAWEWIERALRAAPGDALTQRLAGQVLLQQNDLEAARSRLERLDLQDPATARALATTYLRQQRPGEAQQILERAVAGGADDRATLFLLATSLQRLGRSEEAQRLFAASQDAPKRAAVDARLERIQREAPGTARLLREAASRLESGDLEGAEALYRQVLESNPDDFAAILNLANVLGRSGRPLEALPMMERAVEMRPDHPQPHLGLAMAYGSLGRLAEARAELQEVLRIEPDNAAARKMISRLP